MTLFPFFMNIEGTNGIITGGGKHALEKINRLMPYGPQLHVIAQEVCKEIERLTAEGEESQKKEESEMISQTNVKNQKMDKNTKYADITISRRNFRESDLDTCPSFVIVAGEDAQENHWIAGLCRERGILVNVVDDQEYCDFIFPSLIAHGNLSIGICTNGASPSTGVLLKRKIEEQIPEHIEEILNFLQEKRPEIMEAFPDKKKRFAFYYNLSELCMAEDRVLSQAEFEQMVSNAK